MCVVTRKSVLHTLGSVVHDIANIEITQSKFIHCMWFKKTLSNTACVASVSARVRREKLGREQKKGMTREAEGGGGGGGGNACQQTPRF